MILKLLVVIGVVWIVYSLFIKKKPLQNNRTSDNKKNEKFQSNDMVECSSCGTYVSVDDSIISNNKYYCSNECVDKV